MKIAIASLGNPRSVGTWSGIPAHIIHSLESKGHHIIDVTLKAPKEPWYYNWLRRFYYRTQKKWFAAEVEERWLKAIGKQLDANVDLIKPEVVIVIHGDFLAYTTFTQPACLIHDTTFATLVGYYSAFTNLTQRSIKKGNQMYQRALLRTDAAIFSSAWASDSAINDYKTPASKVFTIPLGANLIKVPNNNDALNWIQLRLKSKCCNLLFLGVDWERKGGPDTLKFLTELNRLGVESRLSIVGCDPIIPKDMEKFVIKYGFLRKDNEVEAKKIETLLKESHALILPSLAECYGCVYCEANAYGLPALARDTGGVPEIIKHGLNGLLLKPKDEPEKFANVWSDIWNNQEKYMELALNSRKEFDTRLNYDVFTIKLESILTKLINKI